MKAHPAGANWEQLAERYLRRRGLSTVRRNYHCRLGELDLIMRDGATTVFVEVRYRRHQSYGGGLQSVTRHKQLKMARAASMFLAWQPALAAKPCRFDVLAISGSQAEPKFNWVRDAFQAPGQ